MARTPCSWSLLALAVLASGCEGGFPSPALLTSLRVLAVQPEPASGVPGEPVTLSMLVTDGRRGQADEPEPAPPQILWIGGCHNPPSRQYFGCYPAIEAMARQLAEASPGSQPPLMPVPGLIGVGTEFEFPVPEGILEDAPRYESDPIHFGVSYIFFAACAGELRLDLKSSGSLPVSCFDSATGRRLGSEDYVEGFTTVYTYEDSLNHNPELEDIEFAGAKVVLGPCAADDECEALAADLEGFKSYACSEAGQCIPAVARCANAEGCPEYSVEPMAQKESAEPDPSAPEVGHNEILWLSFYSDGGEFSTETRLLNDRETGWIDNHDNGWRPVEKAPRTVRLFVTLNDNRGGADWRSFDVMLRDP